MSDIKRSYEDSLDMRKCFVLFFLCFAFGVLLIPMNAFCKPASSGHVLVLMKTSLGDIKIDLNGAKAPLSVKNFLQYVDSGFYDGTLFHRVIPGFMIQAGGFQAGMRKKRAGTQIKNEAANGLTNDVGTIAMARTSAPDSATSQFFINVNNNMSLNHRANSPVGYGYAVFGKVVAGMDVVNKIVAVKTIKKRHYRNVPANDVLIKSVTRVK